MMEGFPLDMTEDDVSSNPDEALSSVISCCWTIADKYIISEPQIAAELRVAYFVDDLEDIRVIRDRQTS